MSREKEVKEILDGVQRALVCLYEEDEKPDNPIEYVANLLGATLPTAEALSKDVEEKQQLRIKIAEAEIERDRLHHEMSLLTSPKTKKGDEDGKVEDAKCVYPGGAFPKQSPIVPPVEKKPLERICIKKVEDKEMGEDGYGLYDLGE